jgi:hypothetical protein
LLAAAAGLLVRGPNDDTGHPTKIYFFLVCTLDRPMSTLDIQCANWHIQCAHCISSVLTGLSSVHTGTKIGSFPVC